MKPLVLDASIVLAWCFEDEESATSERAAGDMSRGANAICPVVWPFEIANALRMAERRRRIQQAEIAHFLEGISGLDISIDSVTTTRVWGQILALAREHALSVYDAAYLELAMREGRTLATLDRALAQAAERAGIPLLGPA